MEFAKWLAKVFVMTSIGVSFSVWWSFTSGYRLGQEHALRGIYKLNQAERDALDPEGRRHYMEGKP